MTRDEAGTARLVAKYRSVFSKLTVAALMLLLLSHSAFGSAVPIAEHHLHIRSAEAARLLAGMDGERAPESLEPQSASEALAAMDAAAIEIGFVLSLAYLFGSPEVSIENEYKLVQAENDYVSREVAQAPRRLFGACSVNPLAEYALVEIKRCRDELGLVALKLHLANSGVDLRNPEHVERLKTVFLLLAKLKMPAAVHLRTQNEEYGATDARIFIDSVLSQVPDLPLQIAHMGGWGGYDEATDSALGAFEQAFRDGRLDNPIWFDLGAVVFHPMAAGENEELAAQVREANQMLANRIRAIGLDRVVFATDWPSWPPVGDASQKLAVNLTLIEQALPLEKEELARIYQNVVPWLHPE